MWFSRLVTICLSDRPFLCDIVGGSLKIWFNNVLICCIRYHFLVRISLRFGTAVWCCVTKGKIRFFVLFRWRRACAFLEISLLRVCCLQSFADELSPYGVS